MSGGRFPGQHTIISVQLNTKCCGRKNSGVRDNQTNLDVTTHISEEKQTPKSIKLEMA